MTLGKLLFACVGYLGSSKAPFFWKINIFPGDQLQWQWVTGAIPPAASQAALLKSLKATGRSLRVLCVFGNPTQALNRLSTQIQCILRCSWPCHKPGEKTMNSHVAPLKSLIHEEQPMACSTGGNVLPCGILRSAGELLERVNMLVCVSSQRIARSAQAT